MSGTQGHKSHFCISLTLALSLLVGGAKLLQRESGLQCNFRAELTVEEMKQTILYRGK